MFNLTYKELIEKKKKVEAHRTNLECRKEQLAVLIEKLSTLSSERKDFMPIEQSQGLFSRLFSMGDQLKQAEKNKKNLETELSQVKNQIETINNIISERKLSNKE